MCITCKEDVCPECATAIGRCLNARVKVLIFLVIVVIGAPVAGFGQWLHYPTVDVPRNADGSRDLTAPAPRLPDGKADFSGIWRPGRGNPCTPESNRFVECGTEVGGSLLVRNIGEDLPGGLPYQPWAAELVKLRTAEDSVDDPHGIDRRVLPRERKIMAAHAGRPAEEMSRAFAFHPALLGSFAGA